MLKKTDIIDFYGVGGTGFQSLVNQLLAKEPYIIHSAEFGASGYKQFGIDSNAHRWRGGHAAAQAKCYRRFALKDLEKAYQEFKVHLDEWKKADLRMFILAVSCDVRDPRVNKRVMEINNFLLNEHHITFILWDAKDITNKLRPHRFIARQFIDNDHTIDVLCGEDPEVKAYLLSIRHEKRMASGGGVDLSWADESTTKELNSVQDLLRRGRGLEALNRLEHLQQEPTWPERSIQSQARILRTTASLYLSVTGDEVLARSAARTAQKISPSEDDLAFEIELLQFQGRIQEALDAALRSKQPRIILMAASLLVTQQPEAALQLLQSVEEPRLASARVRLTAIALALTGDLDQALNLLEQRLPQEPEHYELQLTLANLHYFSALSPALRRAGRLGSPLPVSPSLLQRNTTGIQHLRQVQQLTEQLLSRQHIDPHLYQETVLLRVAALANDPDPDRQAKAEHLVQEQLKTQSATPELVMWALFFQWGLDLTPHLDWLLADPSPNGVLAVLQWHVEHKDFSTAEQVFTYHAERLRAADPHVFQTWQRRLAQPGTSALHVLTARLRLANQVDDAERQLQAFLDGTGELTDTIAVLQEAGGRALVSHADALIQRLRTPGAVFVCMMAAVDQNEFDVVVRLNDTYHDLLDGAVIPEEVRRALILASTITGHLPQALNNAQILADEQPSAAHLLHLAQLSAMAARTTELPSLLRRVLTAPDLTSTQALHAAGYAAAIRERRLTAQLGARAQALIRDDADLEAVALAMFTLRIPGDDRILTRYQHLLSEGRAQRAQLISTEDIVEFLGEPDPRFALYDQGAVGVHLIYEHDAVAFARALLCPQDAPLYTHFGGLESRWLMDDPATPRPKTLRLDLTTLLLLAHLDVLDVVAEHFDVVVAASHVHQLTTLRADPSAEPFHAGAEALQIWIRSLDEEGKLSFTSTVSHAERDLGPQLHGFVSLLLTCPPDQHLCVDDRWAQLASLRAGRAVMSTVDLLDELNGLGALTEERLFDLRQRLRRENRRFIPVTAEEIVFWVQQADVLDDQLIETPDLILLRQYYAACLASDSHLMPITVHDQRIGEGDLPFVLQYMHKARDAIQVAFRHLEHPQPAARWIFESLFFDTAAFGELNWAAHPLGRSNDLRDYELISLAFHGASLSGRTQEAYYTWVYRTLIQPRLTHDPELQQRFAIAWKQHIRDLIANAEDKTHRGAVMLAALSAETHLPALHAAAFEDTDYLEATGRKPLRIMTVDSDSFNLLSLWKMFPRLVADPDLEEVLESESREEWRWRVIADGKRHLLQGTRPSGEQVHLRIGELWLSLGRRVDREQHRAEILSTLPGVREDDPRVKQLFLNASTARRLDLYMQLQRSLSGTFYQLLKQQLKEKGVRVDVDRSEWIPGNPATLLSDAGLGELLTSPDPDLDRLLAQAMAQGHPVQAALDLAGVPVAWPEAWIEAALQDERPDEETRRFIRWSGGSVMTLAHVVYALRTSSKPEHVRWRRRAARLLVSESAVEAMDAVLASVTWTFERLHLLVPQWPELARLTAAWLHGHQLYRQLSQLGYTSESIARIFKDDRGFLSMQARFHDRAQVPDAANPLGLSARRAVLALFAYAAEDLTDECTSALRACLAERGSPEHTADVLRYDLMGSDMPRPDVMNSVFNVQLGTIFSQLDIAGIELFDMATFASTNEPVLSEAMSRPNFQPQLLWFMGQVAKRIQEGLNPEVLEQLLTFDAQDWDAPFRLPGLLGAAWLTAGDESGAVEAQILSEVSRHLPLLPHTRQTAIQVYEILMVLANHPRHDAPHRWLASQLDTVARPHDALRRVLFPVVLRYATEAPADEAAPFWPVLLNWRRLNSTLSAPPDEEGAETQAAS